MSSIQLLFYLFGALVVVSALVVLFTKNVLYAAFSLIFTFLSVAAVYVFAGADFIAITQIVVYVGGILILMIFGVMLTNRLSGQTVATKTHNTFWGLVIGTGMLAVLFVAAISINYKALDWFVQAEAKNTIVQQSTISTLGIKLMTDYVLPFELAGVLLLVALIGAAFIAKKQIEG